MTKAAVFPTPQAKAAPASRRSAAVRLGRFLIGASIAALLAGCGGGGGGGSEDGTGGEVTNTAETLPPAAAYLARGFVESFSGFVDEVAALRRTEPYLRQEKQWRFTMNPLEPLRETNPLASARIDYAHAAGLTGRGVTVAVMDEGFLAGHEALAGKDIVTASSVAVADHGTAVASVVAGRSASFIGVAPEARLVLGSFETAEDRLALTRRAMAEGAIAINNSWGYPYNSATRASFDAVFFSDTDKAWLDALRDFSRHGVVVFAASNTDEATSAGIMEGLPLLVPELTPGWLAVVNGDAAWTEETIVSATRISAPCAEAAPWCLAAEGTWEAPDAQGTASYGLVTGTSFAAPMVSGALALLQQAFPDHTPHQLRIRLLASADNDFAGFTAAGSVELAEGVSHAYSNEWGHGFLDVRAALLPIGRPASQMADGSIIDVTAPVGVTGGAVGDAVSRSLAGTGMIATDALGGDFRVAPDAVLARAAGPDAADRLAMASGRQDGAAAMAFADYGGPQVRLRTDKVDISALVPLPGADRPSMGVTVGRTIGTAQGELYVGLSVTQDDGRLLPSGIDGTAPVMQGIEIGYRADAGDAFLSVGGGIAWAETEAMGPLGAADLTLTGLSLTAGARDLFRRGDSLRLGIDLPMTVTSGRTTAILPTARAAGGMVYDSVAVDFAPESREVNLSLVYDMAMGNGAEMFVGAMHSFNHGNVAGASDSAATMGLRLRF